MKRSQNCNQSNQNTQYKQSIVVFLDILGFKSKIKNSCGAEEIARVLRSMAAWNTTDGINAETVGLKDAFYNSSKFTNSSLDIAKIESELRISYFSDTLVLTLPYDNIDFLDKLNLLIWKTAQLMGDCAMAESFIRGGIAIGQMYHEKNIFFGKAYLDAYELESEVANYPRVIFSAEIMSAVGDIKKLLYTEQANDGVWFIDWIKWIQDKRKENNKYVGCSLESVSNYSLEHIKKVVENSASCSSLKVKSKYDWLLSEIRKHEL